VPPGFSCLLHTLPWGGPPQSLWLQHDRKESHTRSQAQDVLLGSRLMYIHPPLGSLTDLQLSISTLKVVTCPQASFLPAPRVCGMALPTAVTRSWSVPYASVLPGPSPPCSHLSPAPFFCAGPTSGQGGFCGPLMASNSAQAFTTQHGYRCPLTHGEGNLVSHSQTRGPLGASHCSQGKVQT